MIFCIFGTIIHKIGMIIDDLRMIICNFRMINQLTGKNPMKIDANYW